MTWINPEWEDLGFPPCPIPPPADPYHDPEFPEDRYCEFCGNGEWKHHAPWCAWADVVEGVGPPEFDWRSECGETPPASKESQ